MHGITIALLGVVAAWAPPASTGLRDWVGKPDPSFRFEIAAEERVGRCKAFVVRMTSQTWRGTKWRHWLSVLVPERVEHPGKAILFITGGSNGGAAPRADSGEALLMAELAVRSGAVLAVLQQVPNQPLLGGLYEDDLIAHTFDRFLEGGGKDGDWPLLLPMVKSAVRAMDAVEGVVRDKLGMQVRGFVVSGASKRGWTTWLTAAADRRVIAIAPMVIDMLNLPAQMRRQRRCYGGYSEKIRPYTEQRIQERMETEAGRRLTALVDPFEHLDSLAMPKLIVLGTNDPYWTVDAARLYFDRLPGDNRIFYLPNAGHGLGAGIVPAVVAFFRASLRGEALPGLRWRALEDGGMRVEWEGEGRALLWKARSPDRDFRSARWESAGVAGKGACEVRVAPPAEGWVAYFVEVRFPGPGGGGDYGLSSEIRVLPGTFPYPPPR